MIPELGHFALVLALCMALVQSLVPLAGIRLRMAQWVAVARPAACAQCLFLMFAYLALTYAFVTNDFSVAYVAQNSNSQLPLAYRIAAVWGAHEGSLLLWAFILGIWSVAVAVFSRALPALFSARVIAVMGLVSIGFLLFMLLTSNPFERLIPAVADGRDLNPLLQDPGLVMHPPMLYLGYVGFSVAFAFAIAALMEGRLDATWSRWSRPWTTVAWLFLTLGIALGSWWAYNELGWGGWWFWDPVENASFMPWLVGTALIHSLAVTEKRGAFRSWTVLLAIFTFSLSLLGTFLVRSGVLVSVHAFATDPARGLYILIFLAVVIGGSLALYAWRAPTVRTEGTFELFSRETLLLMNNVLLTAAAATILFGTLYPLFMDALGLGKISVGPPYFNTVFVPLMLPMVFLAGIAVLTRWKRDEFARVLRQIRVPALLSIVIGAAAPWLAMGRASFGLMLTMVLGTWMIVTAVQGAWPLVRSGRWSRAVLGMTLAHIGVGAFVIGVAGTSAYSEDRELRMAPAETVDLAGYAVTFSGVQSVSGPNYDARRGEIVIRRDGREIARLYPEKRLYRVQNSPMTESGIDPGPFRDLYVALGEPLEDGAWSMHLFYRPMVRWIWLGAVFMALGGLLAATDRRYRTALPRREAAASRAIPAAVTGGSRG